MKIECCAATSPTDMSHCLNIRRKVFIEEQGVPENRELDGQDNNAAHFIARGEKGPIAACRVRFLGDTAKIERVAVLKEYRNHGIGKTLMKHILQDIANKNGIQKVKLSSQVDAIPFYEKLGFQKQGEEYMDAGMPHYDMVRGK